MMRRVAVVCPNYIGGHYGGVEAVASWLMGAISAEPGFSAEIISVAASRGDETSTRLTAPSTWSRAPSSRWGDVRGTPVEHFGSWTSELEPARYLPRPALTTRLREFDIVQVVSGTPAFGLVAPAAGRPVCLQVATTVASERRHDIVSGPSVRERLGGKARAVSTSVVSRLERQALRRADHTFVENGWMLGQVRSVVGGAGVTLAPPGVDDRWFVPEDDVSDEPYLLTVGRLSSHRKNLIGLLMSYAGARDRYGLRLPLVVAGGGALPTHVHSMIEELGIRPHVRVVEDPPGDELLRLYQRANLFVLASHEEGLGIVLLEAQSCGVPVVSTDNAGATEIFRRGAVGQLVGTFEGSSELMATAITEWARRGGESAVRHAAREFASTQFGNDVSIARFVGRYRELLA